MSKQNCSFPFRQPVARIGAGDVSRSSKGVPVVHVGKGVTFRSEESPICPVWKDSNAVRTGRVRHFHTALWIGYYGPLAMNRVVDEIAERCCRPHAFGFIIEKPFQSGR
ncbi:MULTISPECIES: hypothetical protein [Paenibacillus]|uniref:hypothetical protein n=1 Tax=Paenibacillus TaxID=44249 RepID=UPI002FE1F621